IEVRLGCQGIGAQIARDAGRAWGTIASDAMAHPRGGTKSGDSGAGSRISHLDAKVYVLSLLQRRRPRRRIYGLQVYRDADILLDDIDLCRAARVFPLVLVLVLAAGITGFAPRARCRGRIMRLHGHWRTLKVETAQSECDEHGNAF